MLGLSSCPLAESHIHREDPRKPEVLREGPWGLLSPLSFLLLLQLGRWGDTADTSVSPPPQLEEMEAIWRV